jgi:acylphosphatase
MVADGAARASLRRRKEASKESPSREARLGKKARRFIVRGRVQGVGYRHFALQTANAMGITGFVRNNHDGTVEAWGEGSEEVLVAFEDALRRGPLCARVEEIGVEPVTPRGSNCFEVR